MSDTISSILSAKPSAAPTGLPEGVSGPPAAINPSDQAGLVAILTALALGLVIVALPIRIYVRSKLGSYKLDDYAFLGATVFSIAQAVAIFYMLKQGFGKMDVLFNSENLEQLQKAAYSADILYVFTLLLSKCSTGFLFLRLTPGRGHWLATCSTIAVSFAWAIISIFLVALRCHPGNPWTDVDDGTCPNLLTRWIFIAALDAFTEVMLFSISIYLVWAIQMAMKYKIIIVAAFGCRTLVIGLIGLRLSFLHKAMNSPNPHYVGAAYISCGQLEIGYSILASIIPCLKSFVMPYDRPAENTTYAHYLHSHELGSVHTSKGEKVMLSSDTSNDRRAKMKNTNETISSLERRNKAINHDDSSLENGRHLVDEGDMHLVSEGRRGLKYFAGKGPLSKLRPEQVNYEATVHSMVKPPGDNSERQSGDSSGSRRMIIKKGVEWSVDYDTRTVTPAEEDGKNHRETHPSEAERVQSRGTHS